MSNLKVNQDAITNIDSAVITIGLVSEKLQEFVRTLPKNSDQKTLKLAETAGLAVGSIITATKCLQNAKKEILEIENIFNS